MKFMKCLHEDANKKKDTFCTSGVGPFKLLLAPTSKYEFYGFNDDLREAII